MKNPSLQPKKIKEKFKGGVEDFKFRCGACKKRVYPDPYCRNLRCPYCQEWGLERHAKKGEWELIL